MNYSSLTCVVCCLSKNTHFFATAKNKEPTAQKVPPVQSYILKINVFSCQLRLRKWLLLQVLLQQIRGSKRTILSIYLYLSKDLGDGVSCFFLVCLVLLSWWISYLIIINEFVLFRTLISGNKCSEKEINYNHPIP